MLRKQSARLANLMHALRVIENLNNLCSKPISKADKSYLLHGNSNIDVYPLQKFLISYEILCCEKLDRTYRNELRNELLARINDPIYIKELKNISI